MCLVLLLSGFKPFVDACIEGGENGEALKYIVKLPNPQDKADVRVYDSTFFSIHICLLFSSLFFESFLGLF